MSPEEASTRNRILKAAVRLLFKGEPENFTTRDIAQEAGVNAAAINYHFQSKENLVEEAVFAASAKAFSQGLAILKETSLPPRERLRKFYEGYSMGLVEFKWITRTAFRDFLMNERGSGRYVGLLRDMVAETAHLIRETGAAESEQKAMALISGVCFPFLMMGSLAGIGAFDFGNPDLRNRYIGLLVDTVAPEKE
jgi:AcrR family transcriptional regulator